MRNVVSIPGELRKRATSDTGRVAMSDARESVTFGELDRRANQVARALREAGFGTGDKLAVLLPNRLEWGEVQYGCFRAGVLSAGINFRFAPGQTASALRSIDADGFLYESRYADLIDDVRDDVQVPADRYIEVGADPTDRSYAEFRSGQSGERLEFDAPGVDAPALVWFTSGTTGDPKPMTWTQRSLINHSLATGYSLGLDDRSSAFLLMPFFHANSQLYYFATLYLGGDVYVHRATGFDPGETLERMAEEGATFTSMVPTHYNQIVHETDVGSYDLSSLDLVLSSSAPLSKALKREVVGKLACDVAEGYGASEIGIPIILRPGAANEKIGSIGVPMTGCDAAVLDPETLEPVDPGETGEIYMRVPSGMEGYYEMPEETAAVTVDWNGHRWMTAGDMGRVDEDGYFYIENRKDDMIITGGENVYPSHVEDALYEHEAIKDVAVVGVPDEKWGERIRAVVIPSGSERPSVEDIREFLRGTVADYGIPKEVVYVEELPRNPTGKILRDEVRDQVGDAGGGGSG